MGNALYASNSLGDLSVQSLYLVRARTAWIIIIAMILGAI